MRELDKFKAELRAKKAEYMRSYFANNPEARKRQNERNLKNHYKRKNEKMARVGNEGR